MDTIRAPSGFGEEDSDASVPYCYHLPSMTENRRKNDEDDVDQRMSELVPALSSDVDAFRKVTDVDEEIFLLYTLSAPEPDRIGLGQLDSAHDSITISVNISDARSRPVVEGTAPNRFSERRAKGKARARTENEDTGGSDTTKRRQDEYVVVTLRQDSTSLRSNAGDTGSIVWRSSVYLAAKLLHDLSTEACRGGQSAHPSVTPLSSILSWDTLLLRPNTTILELGAGTGVLPCLFLSHPRLASVSPPVGLRWIATDQHSIVPLLRRNITQHSPFVRAVALDWREASQVYRQGTASALHAFKRDLYDDSDDVVPRQSSSQADIIITTDCVYNPHLFPSFLDTLSLCARPGITIVLVACELREPDMLRTFLRLWLEHKARWSIHTIESLDVLGPHLARGSVVWAAWREG